MSSKSIENILIAQDLAHFDLNEKEVRVFLSVLEKGASSVQEIADSTGFKRTSVYMYLDTLKEKGFIHETRKRRKKLYLAIKPEKIKDLYEIKKIETEKLEMKLDPMIERILSYCPQEYEESYPSVSYFEGKTGLKKVYEDTLSGDHKYIYTFTAWDDMLKVLPEYLPEYVRRRAKKNIHSNCIAVSTQLAQKYAEKDKEECRTTKFLPKKAALSLETVIYGDKLAMLYFKEKYVGIIIENQQLVSSQRLIFESLWERL